MHDTRLRLGCALLSRGLSAHACRLVITVARRRRAQVLQTVAHELGKVELHDDTDGWTFQLHDHRADFVSVASSKGGVASGTVRGAVVFWPPAYIQAHAVEKGLTLMRLDRSADLGGSTPSAEAAAPNDGAALADAVRRCARLRWACVATAMRGAGVGLGQQGSSSHKMCRVHMRTPPPPPPPLSLSLSPFSPLSFPMSTALRYECASSSLSRRW